MRRYAGEMEDAQRRAEESQRRHDREGDAAYQRNRSSWYREEAPRVRPSGHWQFTALLNSRTRQPTGWRVELDGKLVGMMVIAQNDIQVLSTSSDDPMGDPTAPTPHEIMAAFIKLYPDPSVVHEMRNEQPLLPEFGPPRDWSQED